MALVFCGSNSWRVANLVSIRIVLMSVLNNALTPRDARLAFWRESYRPEYVERFLLLEAQLINSEVEFNKVLGNRASLKAYANQRVRAFLDSATGHVRDPDLVIVNTSHSLSVGGRDIVQQDRMTLTEFAIRGLQDNNSQKISFEGEPPFGLSAGRLASWLNSVDIRSEYTLMVVQGTPTAVNEAMQEHLARQIEFTLFCASVETNFHRQYQAWVTRYLQGDPSLVARGVVFPGSGAAMKNCFVISERARPSGANIVYAPHAPSGDVWYRFDSLAQMGAKVREWATRSTAFIDTHVGSRYQQTAHQFFREVAVNRRRWTDDAVQLADLPAPRPGQPLFGIVAEHIRWEAFEVSELAPQNYRAADRMRRQQFARLNTELKALYTVEARDHALVSFNRFAYDLIKNTAEQALRRRGENVVIDPDLIMIEFSPTESESLSAIIATERAFYAHESERPLPDRYPRFRLDASHPPVGSLNMLELASWSRSLRPGEKYIEMLKLMYLNPAEKTYTLRRGVHHERQLVEMRRAILSEHFQGRLNANQFSQLLSIVQALTTPNTETPPAMGDYPVMRDSVYQFYLGHRRPVEGVYVFRCMSGGRNEDWLYTPQAPDGLWLRPLRQFDAAVRSKGLRDYFSRRVHYTDQRAVSQYFDELEASNRAVNPPDLEVGSRVRDLSRSYDQMIRRVISDVDAQTTSLAEAITGITYSAFILAAQVISMVVPPVGLIVSAILITKNILEGAQAYHEGDNRKAFGHFKDALIDLATLGYGKYKELGKQAITTTQKNLIEFAKDAKSLAEMVAAATGQKVPHQILVEIVQDVLSERRPQDSQTFVL
ncbi:dermonecrotic toxin domain-containing protein [Pseudomonas sp. NPDC086278]|uniref:dermonecrotic toxin domain-containing protein n=1 Tax=Pseudomonas sp. NPDC086278 TaxID=3390646 RepID=UPI003CFDAD95